MTTEDDPEQSYAKFAAALKRKGEEFHTDDLWGDYWLDELERVVAERPDLEDHLVRSKKVRSKEVPWQVSFPLAAATTLAGWTVARGHAPHIIRCLDALISPAGGLSKIKHIRKPVIKNGVEFWRPFIRGGVIGMFPDADAVQRAYRTMTPDYDKKPGKGAPWPRSSTDPKWSRLAPIKLYAVTQGWGKEEVDEMLVPLGRPVRDGLWKLMRVDVSESPKGHRLAYDMHKLLADLADTDVLTINSGFWVYGKQAKVSRRSILGL